jgi:hypothetical protein
MRVEGVEDKLMLTECGITQKLSAFCLVCPKMALRKGFS